MFYASEDIEESSDESLSRPWASCLMLKAQTPTSFTGVLLARLSPPPTMTDNGQQADCLQGALCTGEGIVIDEALTADPCPRERNLKNWLTKIYWSS